VLFRPPGQFDPLRTLPSSPSFDFICTPTSTSIFFTPLFTNPRSPYHLLKSQPRLPLTFDRIFLWIFFRFSGRTASYQMVFLPAACDGCGLPPVLSFHVLPAAWDPVRPLLTPPCHHPALRVFCLFALVVAGPFLPLSQFSPGDRPLLGQTVYIRPILLDRTCGKAVAKRPSAPPLFSYMMSRKRFPFHTNVFLRHIPPPPVRVPPPREGIETLFLFSLYLACDFPATTP